MPTDAGQLATAIETSTGLILVLTGAGISLASGIPTFRGSDPGAVWAHDVTEMATLALLHVRPGRVVAVVPSSLQRDPGCRTEPGARRRGGDRTLAGEAPS